MRDKSTTIGSRKIRTLEVPDASTWEDFRKNAKQVYYERHPDGAKRGPQSRMKEIFTVLYRADDAGLIGKKNLSQGKLVGILQDHFGGTEKEKQNRKRGLYTYAKLWLLLNRKAPNTRTMEENHWISSNFPQAKKLHARFHESLLDENQWQFSAEGAIRTMSAKELKPIILLLQDAEKELDQVNPPKGYKRNPPKFDLICDFQSPFWDRFKARKKLPSL